MLTKDSLEIFRLSDGICRGDDFIHNGGWYNSGGEKIGWGDLSKEDIKRIQKFLPDNDIFVILPESASFWAFVTNIGPIGKMCKTKPEEQNPGIDYVASKASWVITKNVLYRCSEYHQGEDEIDGINYTNITHERVLELMKAAG